MRTITSIIAVIGLGLLAANCSAGNAGSRYSAGYQGGVRPQPRLIARETMPQELRSESYPCYPDGRPYYGPRHPGLCRRVTGGDDAAVEQDGDEK